MAKLSAGLLLYRRKGDDVLVLIAHPGGPIWSRRDAAAWSLPKGAPLDHETDLYDAARREFEEELGLPPPDGEPVPLGEVTQTNGKVVTVWAIEADLDPATVVPGTFTMEWPRGSGRLQEFPELDRVEWLDTDRARRLLVKAQTTFLDRLEGHS